DQGRRRVRHPGRLRGTDLRHRAAGARPGRPARLRRGQGPRGGPERGGHRAHPEGPGRAVSGAETRTQTGAAVSAEGAAASVSSAATASAEPAVRSKSFEELFAELTAKAADGAPGSRTVELVQAGVHTIGKKIVEEAAGVGVGGEHEGA